MSKNGSDYGNFFTFIQGFVRFFYRKYHIQLPELPKGPVVFISHHQNLFGPFIVLLWFPQFIHVWILHFFLNHKSCYKHYVEYTFTQRYRFQKWLAKIIAFPLSIFFSQLLQSAKGIPVYRGSRKIRTTINLSVDALRNGERIVIFPDIDYSDHSPETKEMYDGFLYLEKYYFQATGNHLCFVPLYVSKKKRTILANKLIYFRDHESFQSERFTVYENIHHNLNQLAKQCGDI